MGAEKEILGKVVAVKKQWWLKINTKPVRFGPSDGAVFPHVIHIQYVVNGKEYVKRKWISAGAPLPKIGDTFVVRYNEDKPSKAKIV